MMANQNKKGLRNTLNFSFLGEEFNESLKQIASSYKLWNICSKKPNLKKGKYSLEQHGVIHPVNNKSNEEVLEIY